MEYQNSKIPEGINVSSEHPLKNFIYLLLGVSGAIIAVLLVLFYTIGFIAKWVPFEAEVKWAESISASFNESGDDTQNGLLDALGLPTTDKNLDGLDEQYTLRVQKITLYLQDLANKLALAQELPEPITITVHYIDQPLVNAFATLGGHVFIYQGLIDAVESENGLAMVIAHEIAHVKNRHPIVALSRGLGLGVILSLVTGVGGDSLSTSLAGHVNLLTSLAFSRGQETESDIEAYNTLLKYYGHGLGATELFSQLVKAGQETSLPEILNSHPLSQKRIERLEKLGQSTITDCSYASFNCSLTPLPEFLLND